MRRTKSVSDLTSFSEEPVQHHIGRPTCISDGQLHNRRDQLVQIFEGLWSEIGWELRKCKKPDDLIRILNPLTETFGRDIVSVFCRKTTEPVSAANLRKVRSEWRAITEPKRAADELKFQAQEQLQRVNWALAQAHKNERRMVRRERKKRRKKFTKATRAATTLRERERELEEQLKGLQASFARQELYRFLKSKRYELNPLSLANAGAGFPYMGWRQSMRRCVATPRAVTEGLNYHIFKAIRYITESTNKKTLDALVMSFREQIPLLPSRYRLPRRELAKNWFYLERAIRQAYRTTLRRGELPFGIAKQYFKQLRSQSHVDRILAEQAKLTITKTQRRRRSVSE